MLHILLGQSEELKTHILAFICIHHGIDATEFNIDGTDDAW